MSRRSPDPDRAASGSYFLPDRAAQIRDLLVDPLPRSEPCNLIILTNEPSYWLYGRDARGGKVLDLSPVVPSQKAPTSEHEIRFEAIERLREDWPEDWLEEQYRPNPKASFQADLVIREPEGDVQAVLEFKRSSTEDSLTDRVWEQADRMRGEMGDTPFIVFDGQFYWTIAPSGEPEKGQTPPTPASLDVADRLPSERQDSPLEGLPGDHQRLNAIEDLRSVLSSLSRAQVVIDVPLFLTLLGKEVELPELGDWEADPHERGLERLVNWVSQLTPTVLVSTLLPKTVSTANSTQQFRRRQHEWLPPSVCLECEFQPFESIHSGFRFNLLFFQERREETYFDTLSSIDHATPAEEEPWYEDLVDWLAGNEARHGFTGIIEPGHAWMSGPFSPELEEEIGRVERLGRTENIGDLCEVRMGGTAPADYEIVDTGEDDRASDAAPVLRARDLSSGFLEISDLTTLALGLGDPGEDWMREGDLLISSVEPERTAVVPPGFDDRWAVDQSIIILRPLTSDVNAVYLQEYLSSPTAKKILEARSTSDHRLLISDLQEVPVPLVEEQFIEDMGVIRRAENQLRSKANHIGARRKVLFNAEDGKELRYRLADLLQTSKVVSESVRQAESQAFQVRNFYPYPIAFGYRLIQGLVNPASRCQEQLRIAENVLAFLGSLSLSLLRDEDMDELRGKVTEMLDRGMTHKAWKDLSGACSSHLSRYEDNPLADELVSLRTGSSKNGLGSVFEELVDIRNEFHHGSKPTTDEAYEQLSQRIGTLLEETTDRLAFLTEYPIREVTGIDMPRSGGRVRLTCRRHMGDHPGFRTEVVPHESPLTKGDLYVEIEEDWWINLHPFVTMHTCSKCDNREVYFPDKLVQGGETVELKSFERGHQELSSEAAVAMTGHTRADRGPSG